MSDLSSNQSSNPNTEEVNIDEAMKILGMLKGANPEWKQIITIVRTPHEQGNHILTMSLREI